MAVRVFGVLWFWIVFLGVGGLDGIWLVVCVCLGLGSCFAAFIGLHAIDFLVLWVCVLRGWFGFGLRAGLVLAFRWLMVVVSVLEVSGFSDLVVFGGSDCSVGVGLWCTLYAGVAFWFATCVEWLLLRV